MILDRIRIALALLCAWAAILGAAWALLGGHGGLLALVVFIGATLLGVLILPASISEPPKPGGP